MRFPYPATESELDLLDALRRHSTVQAYFGLPASPKTLRAIETACNVLAYYLADRDDQIQLPPEWRARKVQVVVDQDPCDPSAILLGIQRVR